MSAFTVPVLALGALFIAYRQWRTAQNKLKLDLFDRRMLVYQAAVHAIRHASSHGMINHDEQVKYLAGIQSAKWLFGPNICNYLHKTLWAKFVDLELHNKMSSNANDNAEERARHIRLETETLLWMVEQYSVLDEMCSKYMSLGH